MPETIGAPEALTFRADLPIKAQYVLGNGESPTSPTNPGRIRWKRLLGLLTSAAIAVEGCKPSSGGPTVWNDPELQGHPDRGLTSLTLRFDSQHDPAGSVRMEACFDKAGNFRVVSQEVSPRPGYLVDKTFPHQAKCYPDVWPVSPIDVGDNEKVYLGVGNTDVDLSNVRAYEVKRTGTQTLEIELLSPQTIGKPGTLEMRDAQTP